MRLLNKRKKLNNKGFTLVELLAVVVILAIVMGIAATSILNSINSSRKSSLHSTAQNAANTLNTWVGEDMIVTDAGKKKLGDTFIANTQASSNWQCLKALKIRNADGKTTEETMLLTNALSLNAKDINLDGTPPSSSTSAPNITSTCSALRYNSSTGGYEILLVAVNGGKYYVSSDGYAAKNYAFSRAEGPGTPLSD